MGLFMTIKNNDRAVRDRLNYLRYCNSDDGAVGHGTRETKITEYPRKIEWTYRGYLVNVVRHPYDTKHYHYSENSLEKISHFDSGRKMDGSEYSFLEKIMSACIVQRNHEAFPCSVKESQENTLIKYELVEISDFSELCLPDRLRVLGCDEKLWKQAWGETLSNYFWDGAGYYDSREYVMYKNKDTDYEEIFWLRLEPVINVTINGINCKHHNLTLTEEGIIINSIKNDHQLSGTFMSDGKELKEYLPKKYSEKKAVEVVNSKEIYGERLVYDRRMER